jgi:hypothetical protein
LYVPANAALFRAVVRGVGGSIQEPDQADRYSEARGYELHEAFSLWAAHQPDHQLLPP